MAIRVVSAGTTLVKRITVGTPSRIGDPSVGSITTLDDVNGSTNLVNGTYLRYDSDTAKFIHRGFDSDARNLLSANNAIEYSSTTGIFEHSLSGVVSGTYGSSTSIPIIGVNDYGHIDSISTIPVAGVSNLLFDSSNATISINTADGGLFNARIGLSYFNTADLTEGDNLYYTTARADSAFDVRLALRSTDFLTEGNNLYYTRDRFDSALSDDQSVSTIRNYFQSDDVNFIYDAPTGEFSINDALVRSRISVTDAGGDGSLAYDSGAGILTYTGPSDDEVRAHFSVNDAGGDGSLAYDNGTGIFTYTGPSANEVRSHFQIVDAGGDGGFEYDSTNGLFTYTGPSAAEVRAHLKRGDGISYDSSTGIISVNDSDASVAFNNLQLIGQLTGPADFIIDPAAVGENSGRVIIKGDLQVDGTETILNSTTVTINDKNIILADSAADATAADGAGITVFGANATITYTSSSDTWDLDKPLGSTVNHLQNFNTANLSEGTNLYYTTARADSDAKNSLVGGTGITYTPGTGTIDITNTTVTAGTYGSASQVPVFTVNTQGQLDSAGTVSVAGVSTVSFDSDTYKFTINTADGQSFPEMVHTRLDQTAGTFGSASLVPVVKVDEFGHVDSIGTVSVAGVSSTAFDSASGIFTINTADGGVFLTTIRDDSAYTNLITRRSLSVVDAGGDGSFAYDSSTGQFTYTGPSAAEVRAHFSAGGDLSYNSGTGEFSFDVETVYTQSNFDSDFNQSLDEAAIAGFGLKYDAPTNTLSLDSAEMPAYYTTNNLSEGDNLYYTTARADSAAKNAISITDVGGDGSLAYNASTGVITYTGPSATEVRAHLSAIDGITYNNSTGQFSLGDITPDTVTANSITNTNGVINTTPGQTTVSSDSLTVVDNTVHNSDFTSVEYTVHMDDSDLNHSQISKLLLTYNKTDVFFTEYGIISSFTNDSDIGTLSADVLGANIRLKFQRAAGMGTVNIKPMKVVIK